MLKLAPASQVSGFAKAPPDNGSSHLYLSDSSVEFRTRKKANSSQPDSKLAAKPATGKAKSSSSDQSSDVGPSIRKKVANRRAIELSDSSDKSRSTLQKKKRVKANTARKQQHRNAVAKKYFDNEAAEYNRKETDNEKDNSEDSD